MEMNRPVPGSSTYHQHRENYIVPVANWVTSLHATSDDMHRKSLSCRTRALSAYAWKWRRDQMLGVSFRNAGNVPISAPILLCVRYTTGWRATVTTSFDLSKRRLGSDRTVDGVISISASAPLLVR